MKSGFADQHSLEVYQAFMTGYVQRINNATLNVTIGGVRIGSAKYTRLAQINLKTRIITFSRYAIENVPERGRRYLVIHELAHVKEASHNKRFWSLVERYEPDYRQVGRSIQLAFSKNVKQDQHAGNPLAVPPLGSQAAGRPQLLLASGANLSERTVSDLVLHDGINEPGSSDSEHFYCNEDGFEDWGDAGIIQGGCLLDQEAADGGQLEDYQDLPSSPHSADLFLFGRARQDSENI